MVIVSPIPQLDHWACRSMCVHRAFIHVAVLGRHPLSLGWGIRVADGAGGWAASVDVPFFTPLRDHCAAIDEIISEIVIAAGLDTRASRFERRLGLCARRQRRLAVP